MRSLLQETKYVRHRPCPQGVVQLGTKTTDTKQNMVELVLSMSKVLWGLRLESGHGIKTGEYPTPARPTAHTGEIAFEMDFGQEFSNHRGEKGNLNHTDQWALESVDQLCHLLAL